MTDTLLPRDTDTVLPALIRRRAWEAGPAALGSAVASALATVPTAAWVLGLVLLLPVAGLAQQTGQLTSGQLMEQGFMLTLPRELLHGAAVYRDFNWFWGPLGLWVPALVHGALGWTEAVAQFLGLVYAAGAVLAAYAIGRRWSESLGLAAGVGMALVDRLSDLPEYGALALGLAALYCGWRALESPDVPGLTATGQRWATAAGLLAGAALLFRPDRGLGVAVALAILLAGPVRRPLLWRAMAGVGAGAAAFGIYALGAGFGTVMNDVVWSALKVPGERHLPIGLDSFGLDVWLTLVIVSIGALFGAGWRRRRLSPLSPRGPMLLALGATALFLLPEYLQRADRGHLLVAGSVAVAFVPVALVDLAMDRRSGRVPPTWAWAALLVVGAVFSAASWGESVYPYAYDTAASLGLAHPAVVTVSNDGHTFTYTRQQARYVEEVISRVEAVTKPGDRLFVGPTDLRRTPYADDSIVSLLPQLVPAMHFPDMHPLVAVDDGAQLAADVASARVLVLDAQVDGWREPNESNLVGSAAAETVVAHHFCSVGSYGYYQVMLRCSHAGGGTRPAGRG